MRNKKAVIEYVVCLLLAVVYLIFLDGKAGMFILIALITAPIISVLITLYAKSKLEFSFDTEKGILGKGTKTNGVASFSSGAFLPTPFITVELFADEHFYCNQKNFRLALKPKTERKLSTELTGLICGKGRTGIYSVSISDYLGLVTFDVYTERGLMEYSKSIGIIPDIPDTTLKNELIKSACAVISSEDAEETEDTVHTFGGNPGFEHREYEPGDPIKRINWKLSSKYDKLMVRLDEGTAEAKQYAVLDFMPDDDPDKTTSLYNEERITEGLLAFAAVISKLGKELILFIPFKDGWQQRSIKTMDDVYELQFLFSDFEYKDIPLSRLPEDVINGELRVGVITLFTNSPDAKLLSVSDTLISKGSVVFTAIAVPTTMDIPDLWIIGDDYTFTKYI